MEDNGIYIILIIIGFIAIICAFTSCKEYANKEEYFNYILNNNNEEVTIKIEEKIK